MRLALFRYMIVPLLILSCGGHAEVDKRDASDEGVSTGGVTGVGGTVNMDASGGQTSNGGALSGGASSGGGSSGGASTGGASAGGTSSGGVSMEGGAGPGTGGSEPVPPEEFGHADSSCGAFMWSLDGETFLDCRIGAENEFHPDCVVVDCTSHGDIEAICVFSNHCLCSDDFACEGDATRVGSECEPRVSCVPVE